MKVFRFLGVILPIFSFTSLFSADLSGTVMDKEDGSTLPYATVELLNVKDSSFVKGEACDLEGAFSIKNVEVGPYLLRVSFMGYNTVYRNIQVKETQERPLRVRLTADKVMLEEVKILAAATPVVVKEDTLVYNAEAFRVTDGAMLEDLVKKLPGAQLSKDGKLVVNGKEIKKVLVDGKEFFSNDPKVSLKNLPANIVDNIKTYNKKSDSATMTGVDDDDDEMVLDLTVKKGMKNGWIGNFTGGAGHDLYETHPDFRYELGANLSRFKENSNFSVISSLNNVNSTGFTDGGMSYNGQNRGAGNGITTSGILGVTFAKEKSKQFEYGGNVQYRHTKNDVEKKTKKETFRTSGSTFRNDESTSQRKGDDVSTEFRFKWNPDSMTNIMFRPVLNYSHSNTESHTLTDNFTTARLRNNNKVSDQTSTSDRLGFNATLRFVRKLNTKGRNLSLSAGTSGNTSPSDVYNTSTTHFYTYDEEEQMAEDSLFMTDRYTDRKSNNLTYYVEGAYTEPIFKNHFLQFRYRYQRRDANSYSYVYDRDDMTSYVDSLSSSIENNYNNHQANVILQGKYEKLNYNVGFTFQPQSSSTYNFVGPNKDNNKRQTVFNFSPNLMLRIKFDKQSNLMFRYRGQSAAPDVEYLQEVIDESDPLNLMYGNPNLKPTYTHNASVRFKKYISETQRSWMVNASYRMVQNAIMNRLVYDTQTGVQCSYKENVNGNWNMDGSLIFNTPLRNKDFIFSTTTRGNYEENVSLESGASIEKQMLKILTKVVGASEKISLTYRGSRFDMGLSGIIDYQKSRNDMRKSSNYETFDYQAEYEVTVKLPWKMELSSDLDWHLYKGYSDGFNDQEWLWNAQLSKSFMKNNAGVLRFKVFDLLGQQGNLSRKISDSSISDTEYNTLGSYFLLQFSYKLNNFQQRERNGRKMFDY